LPIALWTLARPAWTGLVGGLEASAAAREQAICGRAVERQGSDVRRRSGPLEAVASVHQQCHTWDCCSSPGVLTRTTGQPSSQHRRTVNVQFAATDVADGTLMDTYCWRSQTWWADYRQWRRGRAHSPLLSPSTTGTVCCRRWCSRLGVFRPTRWRLSSPEWDRGDWNSATLTRQQHIAKTDRRLPLRRWPERWRKPGSRQLGPRDSTIVPMSAVYKLNSNGPSVEPCGTPYNNRCSLDSVPLYVTCCVLSVRNDVNH